MSNPRVATGRAATSLLHRGCSRHCCCLANPNLRGLTILIIHCAHKSVLWAGSPCLCSTETHWGNLTGAGRPTFKVAHPVAGSRCWLSPGSPAGTEGQWPPFLLPGPLCGLLTVWRWPLRASTKNGDRAGAVAFMPGLSSHVASPQPSSPPAQVPGEGTQTHRSRGAVFLIGIITAVTSLPVCIKRSPAHVGHCFGSKISVPRVSSIQGQRNWVLNSSTATWWLL